MTAKEYLSQAKTLDRRINIELKKIEKLRSKLEYCSPGWDSNGSGKSSKGNKLTNAIAKIMEYEEKANEMIDKYIELYVNIEKAIYSLDDPLEREVLERRYLLYQRWESRYNERTGEKEAGIIEDMDYSRRRIFQLHGEGLKKIALNCIELHL